jgi:hypothetical protein
MRILQVVAIGLGVSLILAGLLYSYAFNFEGPYSFLVIWFACAIFCSVYAIIKSSFITIGRNAEFILIVFCGALAGFLAEFLLTGLWGLKGIVSGALIGIGLVLEGLILSGQKGN